MSLPKEIGYTIEDIYNLPDGERAELIDGQIYYMAPPSYKHQRIIGMLYQKIANYIDAKKGPCKVVLSPFAVFLNKDDKKNYVEPDISVICDKSKLTTYGCVGAPDWIIEVVSPSSRQMDYLVKMVKYSNTGVREYWVVDPLKSRIISYNFESNTMEEYSFSDSIKVGIYEDLTIDFAKVSETLDF